MDDWEEETEFTSMEDWDEESDENWDEESEEDWDEEIDVAAPDEIDGLLDFNGKKYEELTIEDFKDIEFNDINKAEKFYSCYSRVIGFSIRRKKLDKGQCGNVIRRQWVCSRQGKTQASKKNNPNDNKVTRTPRKVTRIGCLAAFTVRHNKNTSRLFVSEFTTKHNHTCVDAAHMHFLRSNRVVKDSDLAQVKSMKKSSIKTSCAYKFMVHQAGGHEFVGFTIKDLYNKLDLERRETILDGDAQAAVSWLNTKATKDPGFYCEFNVDSEGRLANMFWRDTISLLDYHRFGDVLVFDSTYKTNIYGMPLVVFVGSNNHRGTVLFGCALLVDETIESYTWILEQFLFSMQKKQPISVLTDGDPAMRRAVRDVLPESRHRLCAWHICNNLFENIKNNDVYPDFGNCLYESLTLDEWEAAWSCMIEKHGLQNNTWMDGMYAKRELWAETFFRGHFFGAMCSTQRCEGMHKDLKEGLGRFSRLYEIMPRMDKTLEHMRNKVKKDEYNSMTSEPVINSHMRSLEKQIAEIYTYDIFLLIRDQIELEKKFIITERISYEGSTVYYLSQYGRPHPLMRWIVSYLHSQNIPQLLCSCKMFECDGIPCGHLFSVMKFEQVQEYPKSLVRKRWTKEATEDVEMLERVEPNCTQDISQIARHGGLAAQCDRICYNGSLTPEGYKEVKDALDKLFLSSERFRVEYEDTSKAARVNNNVLKDPIVAKTKARLGKKFKKGVKSKVVHHHCGICGLAGHNRRTCPELDDNKTVEKVVTSLSTEGSDDEELSESPNQNSYRSTTGDGTMGSCSGNQHYEGESSQSISQFSDNSYAS